MIVLLVILYVVAGGDRHQSLTKGEKSILQMKRTIQLQLIRHEIQQRITNSAANILGPQSPKTGTTLLLELEFTYGLK
jgi:hypothetical protein